MVCQLCHQEKELQRSHIVPDSIFRTLKEDGRTMMISSNPSFPPNLSQDSYWERLFCLECEKFLNLRYERYSLDFLYGRNKIIKRIQFSNYVRFQRLEVGRFHLFVLSVFWRMSIASDSIYSAVDFGDHFNECFRRIVLGELSPKAVPYFLGVQRITAVSVGEIDGEAFSRSILMMPFSRRYEDGLSFSWVCRGFLFTFFLNRDMSVPDGFGVVKKTGCKMQVPYIAIGEIPEFVRALENIYRHG